MKATTNSHQFSNKTDGKFISDLTSPNVYFRGVNRVQINRFKAYTLILSNRLSKTWHITQDIKSANVVVDWARDKKSGEKCLRMSILAGTANLKPAVISSFKLSFRENELSHQLNKASKQLYIAHQGQVEPTPEHNTVKIAGLLNEPLSQICNMLNAKNSETHFIPSVGIFSSKTNLFKEKLLLLVDPNSPESVCAYQTFMHRKLKGDLIINELTIAIIKKPEEPVHEEIFDMIYENADINTQVTLVNFEDESELNSFVAYF